MDNQNLIDLFNMESTRRLELYDVSDTEKHNITDMRHNPDTQFLFIRFGGGDVYAYGNVPEKTALEFEDLKVNPRPEPIGKSPTKFFNAIIKPFPTEFPTTKLGKII